MLLAKRCFKILTHTSHIVHIDFFVKKLKTIPIKNMGQVMCYCGYINPKIRYNCLLKLGFNGKLRRNPVFIGFGILKTV